VDVAEVGVADERAVDVEQKRVRAVVRSTATTDAIKKLLEKR